MRARLALVLTLSVLSVPLSAEEADQPSLELLEFLGGWEDAQGNWMDPRTLDLAVLSGEETFNETGQNGTDQHETGNEQTND